MSKKLSVFISTPFFAILGRAGGMVIPLFIAFFYGVSSKTDAFFFAYALVFFAGALFQQVLESVMVPYFAEQRKMGEGRDLDLALHVAVIIIPFVLIVSLLLAWGMSQFLPWLSGLSGDTSGLAVRLFLEMIPFLLLAVLASAINGLFNTHKVFWYPAISPLIRSVVVVAALFLFHELLGIHALAAGFAAGEALRCLISFYILKQSGIIKSRKIREPFHFKQSLFWSETGIQVAAMAAVQMTPLINQWFATWLGSGEVTLFSYADRLFMIPSQIFIAGISQIFLSHWSEAALESKPEDFRSRVIRETRLAFGIAFVISALLWIFRHEIVYLVYSHGDFDSQYAPKVADSFGWLILGFAPAVLNSLYLRVLFVMRKPVVFCLQSWIKLVLQGGLNVWLGALMGITGLALGTTLATVMAACWITWYVEHSWKKKTVSL